MVTKFFRLTIEGTDEQVLNTFKDWFVTKIDQTDLYIKEYNGAIGVSKDIDYPIWYLNCDMYIKASKSLVKYKDYLVAKFKTCNKSTLLKAKIIKYDDCSHEDLNPKPCKPIILLDWSAK